ncbi:MAG: hypothetical protein RR280_01035 [Bacteroidaceae bacterium]
MFKLTEADVLQVEQLPFLVNATVAAIYSGIFPHIDKARYATFVGTVVAQCTHEVETSSINMQGLYDFIRDMVHVEDIGTVSIPFYATLNGHRCCITSRQTDEASNQYVLGYYIQETGRKAVVVLNSRGESESDMSFCLEDIAPF